jgi:uncharacterized protein with HEPN domain
MLRFVDHCLAHSDFPDAQSLMRSSDDFVIVQRDLEEIGEGMKNLSSDGKGFFLAQGVPVDSVIGFRNHLAHPYFDFDPSFIFLVCQHDLKPLRQAIVLYLETLKGLDLK